MAEDSQAQLQPTGKPIHLQHQWRLSTFEHSLNEDETELAHIRQAKSELLAREEVVCARMKNNRAILSPIRHLPPEILAIIFVLWQETSEIQSRTQSHTPYRIAHVSSRWRAIALNTPRLWTRARLCSSNQRLDESVDTTKAFLQLSRSLSIDLELRVSVCHPNSAPQKGVEHLLEVLLLCMSRVRRLSVAGLPDTVWKASYDPAQTSYSMPLLEELDLSETIAPPVDSSRAELTVFRDAPRVQRARLSLGFIGPNNNPYDGWAIPWSQLTHLTLSGKASVTEVRRVLLQCTSLQHCDLGKAIVWNQYAGGLAERICTSPHLRAFKVYLHSIMGDGIQFFQPLDMPVLALLTIDGPFIEIISEIPLLQVTEYVFPRSGSSLTSLAMSSVRFAAGELPDVLRLLPVLEQIWLRDGGECLNDNLFLALQYPRRQADPGPPLSPRLDDDGSSPSRTTDTALVGMILSRWWPQEEDSTGAPIERMVARWSNIELCWKHGARGVFMEEKAGSLDRVVTRCRKEGLKISIKTKHRCYGDSDY